ncbi:MAG TPA: MCE family protein [bacterium (Candidatus Stahlbacteria)]|nr:MCE family protein [Candidatus Stahlbacteria bacterium]
MSRSKDALVGVFITLVILILIISLIWISSSEHFRKGPVLYAIFEDVEGLRPGASVSVRGIEVGQVEDLTLTADHVLVKMRVRSDVQIRNGSKARIRAFSYLGGERHIEIIPGAGSELLPGETIPGIGSIDIETMLSHLEDITKGLDIEPLRESFDEFNRTLRKELHRGVDQIEGGIDHLETITLKIDSLLTDLREKGTVGRLIQSDDLYQEIMKTNKELQGLLQDMKENPHRYFRVKIF